MKNNLQLKIGLKGASVCCAGWVQTL